jgi:hypothetical protein
VTRTPRASPRDEPHALLEVEGVAEAEVHLARRGLL